MALHPTFAAIFEYGVTWGHLAGESHNPVGRYVPLTTRPAYGELAAGLGVLWRILKQELC